MKTRLITAIVLSLVLALSVIPAFTVSAAENVVYVKDGGTGDGSAADKPLGKLYDAFTKLSVMKDGGTVVLVGNVTLTDLFEEPEHEGKITVTGLYGGKDYAPIINVATTQHYKLNGDTTFEHLTFCLTGTWVMRARFHALEFGEGIVTTDIALRVIPQFFVVGGDQGSASELPTDGDTNLIFRSGTFYEVIGMARAGAPSDYTGTANISVYGDTVIFKLAYAMRGTSAMNGGNVSVLLDGGTILTWVTAGDTVTGGITGKTIITLTKNFDITKSFNDAGARTLVDTNGRTVFNGISGASAFMEMVADTLKGESFLYYDSSIYNAEVFADKINTASFTKIEALASAPAVTTAPGAVVTTAAPAATTAAGSSTPVTADGTFAIIALAVAAAAALAVVISKKRA